MTFYQDAKKILQLATPLLSARIMAISAMIIGIIMVAKLGHDILAASALAQPVFSTLLMISIGVLYASGIRMSHSFGAKNYKKVREYFHSNLILALLLSIFSITVFLAVAALLPHLGQRPQLIPDTKKFLYAFCLPILPALLTTTFVQLFTALQNPRIIFYTSLTKLLLVIFLFYALIFGRFGFPSLGILGFGVAMAIAQVVSLSLVATYAFTSPRFKPFKLTDFASTVGIRTERLLELLKLGIPMGVQFGGEISIMVIMTFLIGIFGAYALSASQISSQIITLAIMVPVTLSESAAILVGHALGRNDAVAIRRYGFSACKLGGILFLGTALVLVLFPTQITGLYIDIHNPNLSKTVHLSVLFLYVGAIGRIFDGFRNVLSGSLRGLHDSKTPMYVGLVVSWLVALPLGIVLSFPLKMGPIGFAIAFTIALTIGAGILFVRFNRKTKIEAPLT